MPPLFPPVESRSIVGTGMAADPEAIDELEQEWARRERAVPPKKKFKQVLVETKAEEKEEEKPKEEGAEEKQRVPPVNQKRSSELFEHSLNSALRAGKNGQKAIPVSVLPRVVR